MGSDIHKSENYRQIEIVNPYACSDSKCFTVLLLSHTGHSEGVSAVEWFEEDEVCTASWDHTIRIWDLQTAEQKSSLVSLKAWLYTKNILILFLDIWVTFYQWSEG